MYKLQCYTSFWFLWGWLAGTTSLVAAGKATVGRQEADPWWILIVVFTGIFIFGAIMYLLGWYFTRDEIPPPP